VPDNSVVAILCASEKVELIADALWGLGATGVAEESLTNERTRLLAGVDRTALDSTVEAIRARFPESVVEVAPTAVPTWRQHASPVAAGPFVLRLPEHETALDGLDLCIEPGDAFGTGSHESTRLALAALATLPINGIAVADIGTGTGVLAIGAALLGAGPVDAVDIAPEAIAVAAHNAELNSVTVSTTVGSVADLNEASYHLIVANLTAAIQRELAPAIAALAHPEATIILSGLLVDQTTSVAEAYPVWRVVDRLVEGQWACLVLSRSPG
jgi:ribosomal protein L11 methyltransferase